jgi:hypothetical protein
MRETEAAAGWKSCFVMAVADHVGVALNDIWNGDRRQSAPRAYRRRAVPVTIA